MKLSNSEAKCFYAPSVIIEIAIKAANFLGHSGLIKNVFIYSIELGSMNLEPNSGVIFPKASYAAEEGSFF